MTTADFDSLIEDVCGQGCIQVNQTIIQLEEGQCPPQLQQLSLPERETVLKELKSVMDVYDGGVCSISPPPETS